MRNAVQLQIRSFAGAIIEDDDRALATDEELLHRQDLPPIAKRVLREQPHFGQRVKRHTIGAASLDGFQNLACSLTKFDFAGMQHRQWLLGP